MDAARKRARSLQEPRRLRARRQHAKTPTTVRLLNSCEPALARAVAEREAMQAMIDAEAEVQARLLDWWYYARRSEGALRLRRLGIAALFRLDTCGRARSTRRRSSLHHLRGAFRPAQVQRRGAHVRGQGRGRFALAVYYVDTTPPASARRWMSEYRRQSRMQATTRRSS